MAIGDVINLTLKQRYGSGGEMVESTFSYLCNTASATAPALITAFESQLLPEINAIQTPTMVNDSARAVNLFDPEDFAEFNVLGSGAGGAGTGTLPAFCVVNYSLKLSTREVRPGSKRFSGLSENFTGGGIFNDTDYIALLNLLRVALYQPISVGPDTEAYTPVVVKRIFVPAVVDEHGPYYRLPDDIGELVYGRVLTAVLNTKISHQVSRGNGR